MLSTAVLSIVYRATRKVVLGSLNPARSGGASAGTTTAFPDASERPNATQGVALNFSPPRSGHDRPLEEATQRSAPSGGGHVNHTKDQGLMNPIDQDNLVTVTGGVVSPACIINPYPLPPSYPAPPSYPSYPAPTWFQQPWFQQPWFSPFAGGSRWGGRGWGRRW